MRNIHTYIHIRHTCIPQTKVGNMCYFQSTVQRGNSTYLHKPLTIYEQYSYTQYIGRYNVCRYEVDYSYYCFDCSLIVHIYLKCCMNQQSVCVSPSLLFVLKVEYD